MILAKRAIAYYIDIIVLAIIIYPFIMYYGNKQEDGGYTVNRVYYFPLVCILYFYFVLLETIWKTTVGKRIFSLFVKKEDGTKITFVDILKRRIFDLPELFFVPFIALAFALLNSKKQRVGDLIAKTIVVDKNSEAR